ncbi:hypothetical protein OQX61_10600 [Pedobacter sp. PLR]|nr:hypothetical protein [Pedobacter sp. PLR]
MKVRYIWISLLFCIGACNQKKQSAHNIKLSITDSNKQVITSANTLAQELKQIQRYSNEPFYYLYVNHEQCFFRILVNDIPVFHYVEDGQIMSPINLNNFIQKSGKQTITYRLYPQTKRTYGEGFNKLTLYTKFDIKLYVRNNADTVNSFENRKLLLTHHAATKTDGKSFIGDGKDYYDYTFDFEAKVPYDLDVLENSKDLSKIDQIELLNKTEAAYRYYWNLIQDKKANEVAKLRFNSDTYQIISEYLDEELIRKTVDEGDFMFTEPSFKLDPLANYRMQLYGNGKVVCLELDSNDLFFRFEKPIWGDYKTKEGEIRSRFERLYLHIPKGKDTFEII